MPNYRYVFGDLKTGAVIEEVALYGVNVVKKLNEGGELRGSFNLDQTGKLNIDLSSLRVPGKTYVVMERNNQPIWGGLVWSGTYQSQAKVCQLYCRGFEAYPEKVVIPSFSRLSTEQRNIFRDLWNTLQATAHCNIGVTVPTSFGSVVPKSLVILASDRKTYRSAMDELADGDTGFDWTIDVGYSEGVYTKTLRIGYPTLGALPSPATVAFSYPGSILNYYETSSIASSGTRVTGVGPGEGSAMLTSTVTHSDLLNNGWCRFDVDVALKGATSQTNLNALTAQAARIFRAPRVVIKAELKGNQDPEFGSYGLGDACQIHIDDPMHPGGTSLLTRVTQWTLRPQNDEQSEQVDLVFEGDDL